MTVAEYIRLVAKIAVLKEVAEEYPGKTIENIILQMEAVKMELAIVPQNNKTINYGRNRSMGGEGL